MPTRDGILDILDASAEAFVFPMLDNGYVYPAAARLSCFAGADGWAFVFETFGFSPRAGMPDSCVTSIGEGLVKYETRESFADNTAYEAFEANNAFWRQDHVYPIENDDWMDTDAMETIRIDAQTLTLRGQEIAVPRRETLEHIDQQGGIGEVFHIANVARALADAHRDAVLASDAERRVRIPADWSHLLTLDEWSHPDVIDPDNRPSASPTMRSLAEVIVAMDAQKYVAEKPNTHWSNWPDGGTL